MKRTLILLAICSLFVFAQPSNAQQATEAQDKAAIEKILQDNAQAVTDLPRTRDIDSIFKSYVKDSTNINDGKYQYEYESRRSLEQIVEGINLGNLSGIVAKVDAIKVNISGGVAWATYNQILKLGKNGEVLYQEDSLCTSIFKKISGKWLIVHDHCSSIKNNQ